MKKWC